MSTLLVYPYLKTSECETNRDVQWCIDDACYWFDQRHEEQREPDDADEQHNDHAAHPVLHHLLLFLTPRLRVTLEHTRTYAHTIKRSTENLFYSFFSILALNCIYINLIYGSGSYPGNSVTWEYTLSGMPVHHKAPYIHTHTLNHTQGQFRVTCNAQI